MSEFSLVRRCYGCGAILQSDNPSLPGYIEKEKLVGTPISTPLFCSSCWKETKYNLSPKRVEASPEFLLMLKDAQASDALIVYLVDLFSFETSFSDEAVELLEGLKILVLANKRDLLPESADDDKLREYVAHRFRRAKLQVVKDDVELVSLRFASDLTSIVARINKERKGHDVYVIGAASSGKSVFANAFLRTYKNPSNRSIELSDYPGTDIRVLTIPLDSSSSLYDTPGTSLENSIIAHVDVLTALEVSPKEEVKGRNFSLSKDDCLFIGDHLARLQMLEGEKTSVTAYLSKEVSVKKSKNDIGEQFFDKVIQQFSKEKAKGLSIAPSACDIFDLKVEETGERDIGIEGLGWFSFKGNGQTFRIYVPKGVALYTSKAKIAKEK